MRLIAVVATTAVPASGTANATPQRVAIGASMRAATSPRTLIAAGSTADGGRRAFVVPKAFQFSDADWKRTLNRYRFCCAYCGESGPLTMDHVVPISRGGRHSIGNVVPACGPCNFGKHTSLAIEWRRRLDERRGDAR